MIDNGRSLTVIGEMLPYMTEDQRIRFLLSLAQELTIAARDTYEVGSDGVQQPSDLRHYNETLHRVLANLREIMERQHEEVWCRDRVLETSRTLPSITTACYYALERTRKLS